MKSLESIFQRSTSTARHLGRTAIMLLLVLSVSLAKAQVHPFVSCILAGTNPVTAGNTYTYSLSGSCTATSWSTSCGTVQSSTSTTVTIFFNSLTCSTATIQAINGGVTQASLTVTVNQPPTLNYGTISNTSQTINYNTTPAQINASAASGGSCGSYSYQWYSSPDSTTWTGISGATGQNYQPGALTTTMYYKRSVNCGIQAGYTNVGKVTVYPQVQSGTVSSAQTINYNSLPNPLSVSGYSGGNGTYTYQWQSSTSSGFTSPTNVGTNSTTYSPPALMSSLYYRVVVSSNGAPANSLPVLITVYPQMVAGSVTPASQTVANGGTATSLIENGQTGGSGTYTYQWQSSSASDGTYTAISGATSNSYTPTGMTGTTYYVIIAKSNGASDTTDPVVVDVNNLTAGAITPASIAVASGTSPGVITCTTATGGNCSGSYTYQWQSSTDGIHFTSIIGATSLSYSPGNVTTTTYYQLTVTCGTQTAFSTPALVAVGTINSNLSYIRTRTLSKPLVTSEATADALTSPSDVQQSTSYLDGLGRTIQTVAKQASPALNDMVTIEVYDPYGRSATDYLPYTSASTNGLYKTDPIGEQTTFSSAQFPNDQFFYGQTAYEASPLNRTSTLYAAGNSWVGANRGVSTQYLVNSTADSVQFWTIASAAGSLPVTTGLYPAGTLYESVTIDEAGHQVVEYTDMQGKMLLKKMQVAAPPSTGPTGWLNTYYIYDTLSNLRFVVQPQAVLWLMANSWNFLASGGAQVATGLCFRYEYDFRKRMYIRKIPGAGESWMVYDNRDRLVMTQDSMRRSAKQWLVTCYDSENRADSTGMIADPTNYNNLAYHTNAALSAFIYPTIASYTYTPLIQTHYDDYAWVTALHNVLSATMDTSFNSNTTYFSTNYNNGPVYAVDQTPLMITRGLVTGTTQYVLTNSSPQWDVKFYDDRARVIEVQSINYTNGLDKDINQYDFSGKVVRHLLVSKKNGVNPMGHTFCNMYTYDPAFRMTGVKDNIDGAVITVDTLIYDELGRLRAKYLGGGIDSLVYSYNIRNWTTGINQNYVGGTANDYFGMEIGYDLRTSVSTTTYAGAQYNGNITGFIWKSAGDGINRKYDFVYDNANRATNANFLQNPSGFTWNTAVMDYTVGNLNYDANGNILTLNQRGFKVGFATTALIDQLTYTYQTSSNQLSKVVDGANDTASTLGDFHYKTKGSFDYIYDGNGNLKIDNNKAIDSIQYNYLNLPQYIHLNGKGSVTFAYDATGLKEAKIVVDSTLNPVQTTTTLYIKNYQYTNDTLAQANFEEGRARWQKKYLQNGDSIRGYFYDYFLKDHLDNTRVILTTQKDTAQYMATMEAAYRAKERMLFYNIDSTSYPKSSVPGGYPTDNTTVPNDSVAMVEGNVGSHTTGPALLLKVMTGDSISVGVKSYYLSGGTAGTNTSSLNSVLNTLAGGLVALGGGGGHGTLANLDNTSGSPVYAALNSFMPSYDTTPASKPKAYLNWMLLDNQFNYVSGNNQSGAIPIGSPNALNTLAATIKLKHSGYLYIWVSNETQNWMVFFDNLTVQDFSGPMLEETHYYPFGLTMAGISDKALKNSYAENKYRWNKGSELQNKEFSDGSGLEIYGTKLREMDPQLGRWWQADPKTDEAYESISPYAAMNDAPIRFNDPNGDEGEACCDWEGGFAILKATQKVVGVTVAAGLGPEDPITDAVAGVEEVGGDLWALGKVVFGHSPPVTPPQAPSAPKTSPSPPKAPTAAPPAQPAQPGTQTGTKASNPAAGQTAQAKSNQGSGEGRGKNNRKPDPAATGDHSVSNDKGSTTYQKNSKNPSGFQEVKRVDTKGSPHNGVPTPHVQQPGQPVRAATPGEIPKVDLSKNVPPKSP